MARIIAIANQKGGVGKTATTANLGASLARLGHPILIVDMDPQGNLTASFGIEEPLNETVADGLLNRQRRSLPILNVLQLGEGRLDLVPANLELAAAETSLVNKLGREFCLRDQLVKITDHYRFILIDTPPSLGLLTLNALVAASRVIVPTEARFFSLQGLQMLEQTIREVKEAVNPTLEILGIVLSKYDRRLKEEQHVAAFLREHWGTLVFETEVGVNSKILEAASAKVPVYEIAKGDRASEVYRALAEEVLARG